MEEERESNIQSDGDMDRKERERERKWQIWIEEGREKVTDMDRRRERESDRYEVTDSQAEIWIKRHIDGETLSRRSG